MKSHPVSLFLPAAVALCLTFAARSLPGQSTTFLRGHIGTQPSEYFGETIEPIGDLDRDGHSDYLIGGSRYSPPGLPAAGSVLAISGATGQVLYRVHGQAAGGRMGFAIAALGDRDGDGVDDFAAGAPFDDAGATDAGRVTCFSGATGAVIWTQTIVVPEGRLGWSLARLNLPGGHPAGEVLAGAPGNLTTSSSRVLMLNGFDGSVYAAMLSPSAHRLGTSVAAWGDGRFALGAPGSAGNQGSVRFFSAAATRTGLSLMEQTPLLGTVAGGQFGSALEPTSLPSGANLLVGAIGDANHSGRVHVVQVGLTTASTVGLLAGFFNGDQFGFSIGSGRDVNGDGVQDIVVGAPTTSNNGVGAGRIYVVYGATLQHAAQLDGNPGDARGWDVAILHDIDNDGLSEIAIGDPLADPYATFNAGGATVLRMRLPGQLINLGPGCAPGNLWTSVNQMHAGSTIAINAAQLSSQSVGVWCLGLQQINVDLTGIGMTGCVLYTSPLVTPTLVGSVSGAASFPLTLPNDLSLYGNSICVQAALFESAANRVGLVLTEGERLVIGS